MKDIDVYESVRRFVMIEGGSRRAAARLFGIDRKTVDKRLTFLAPPRYRQETPRAKPKLGPFLGVIGAILTADFNAPPKQHHTAKRIWERLRDEHCNAGGYDHDRVNEVVRERGRRLKEAFVPLAHPPCHAQVDFGLFRFHLAVARERPLGIGGLRIHPVAQHRLMPAKITRGLDDRNAPLRDPFHRF